MFTELKSTNGAFVDNSDLKHPMNVPLIKGIESPHATGFLRIDDDNQL